MCVNKARIVYWDHLPCGYLQLHGKSGALRRSPGLGQPQTNGTSWKKAHRPHHPEKGRFGPRPKVWLSAPRSEWQTCRTFHGCDRKADSDGDTAWYCHDPGHNYPILLREANKRAAGTMELVGAAEKTIPAPGSMKPTPTPQGPFATLLEDDWGERQLRSRLARVRAISIQSHQDIHFGMDGTRPPFGDYRVCRQGPTRLGKFEQTGIGLKGCCGTPLTCLPANAR